MKRAATAKTIRPTAIQKNVLAQHIAQFSEQIAEHFHPDKIILFGSQAYGTPTPESDIDLLVVGLRRTTHYTSHQNS